MNRAWFWAILILAIGLVPFVGTNPASAQVFDGLISRVGLDGAAFDVYGRIGYQRMSVNLNVPVAPTDWPSEFSDMDVKMAKQDFAIGTVGISGFARQRFALFAEASVSAQNSGAVETVTSYAWSGFSGLSWCTEKIRWWEVNLGGSVNILDSGTLLLGYKFDRLTQKLKRPRELVYSEPRYSEYFDYVGDFNLNTWSPYVGLRFEDRYWRVDLIWSPWLTSYRAEVPLRWAWFYVLGGAIGSIEFEDARYGLGGKGGNLLEAYAEARSTFFSLLQAKLWGKVRWLNCRGNGERDFSYSWYGVNQPSESHSAPGSLTRYLWAVGIAGDLTF